MHVNLTSRFRVCHPISFDIFNGRCVTDRFNQTTVAYDASKTERLDALKRKQEEVEERLRDKKGTGSGTQ